MRALDFNTRTQVTRSVQGRGVGVQKGSPVGHLVLVLVMAYLWVVKGTERKLRERVLSLNEKRQLWPGSFLLIQPWELWGEVTEAAGSWRLSRKWG